MKHLTSDRIALTAVGLVLAAIVLPSASAREESGDALARSLAGVARGNLRNLVSAAEAMPEEHYGFRPATEARSFAELVAHMVDSNRTFCSAAGGAAEAFEPEAEKTVRESGLGKQALLEALESATEECHAALDAAIEAGMDSTSALGGGVLIDGRPVPQGELPVGALVSLFASHTNLHYGNMATYLRMKGVVPPTSRDASN